MGIVSINLYDRRAHEAIVIVYSLKDLGLERGLDFDWFYIHDLERPGVRFDFYTEKARDYSALFELKYC
jgi:hypothetical protein